MIPKFGSFRKERINRLSQQEISDIQVFNIVDDPSILKTSKQYFDDKRVHNINKITSNVNTFFIYWIIRNLYRDVLQKLVPQRITAMSTFAEDNDYNSIVYCNQPLQELNWYNTQYETEH